MSETTAFDQQVNNLLGYVQSEMVKGRLTGVQAEVLVKGVNGLALCYQGATAGRVDAEVDDIF